MKWVKLIAFIIVSFWGGGCSNIPLSREAVHWCVSVPDDSKRDTDFILALSAIPDDGLVFALTLHGTILKPLPDGRKYRLTCFDLSFPTDISVNGEGEIFIADTGNHVVKKVLNTGQVTVFAGKNGVSGFRDGKSNDARFQWPCGVTVDGQGGVVVADSGNNAIRRIRPDGFVETLAGRVEESQLALFNKELRDEVVVCESVDGDKTVATLRNPIRVAVGKDNCIYILCAALNEAHFDNMVRKLNPDGTVVTLAGETHVEAQFRDGKGRVARLFAPEDIAVDSAGNVYVLDDAVIRKISTVGEVTTTVGTRGQMCDFDRADSNDDVEFRTPACLAIDSNDNLLIGDEMKVWQMTPSFDVTTFFEITKEP